MKPLFIIMFIFCTTSLFARQASENWYPGKVKLMDGTELVGDIDYNLDYQTVKIRINGQTTTLKEAQLASMVIFAEKYRHEFEQVALKNEQGEVSYTFTKMIYRSPKKFSLFKEYIAVTEDYDINPMTGRRSIGEQPANLKNDPFSPNPKLGTRMDVRYFLADNDGNHHPITEKGLTKAYGQCFNRVKNFIVRNRLMIKKETDLVRIIRYADSLANGCTND